MDTLFPLSPAFPEGFTYFADFISEKEENELCNLISKLPLNPLIFQGYEAKRLISSFGVDYQFNARTVTKGKPIPAELSPLIKRVAAHLSLHEKDFAEVLITHYPPGSVINWHRDGPPFAIIAGVSLLSDCMFRLRPHNKARQSRATTLSFPVKRRSLYVIQGISREEWQHSILPVKYNRYSITLRTLKSK